MMPMVPPGGQSPTLTLEQARSALKECSDCMDQPDVVAQITAAKAAAGPDPMMAMMLVRRARQRRAVPRNSARVCHRCVCSRAPRAHMAAVACGLRVSCGVLRARAAARTARVCAGGAARRRARPCRCHAKTSAAQPPARPPAGAHALARLPPPRRSHAAALRKGPPGGATPPKLAIADATRLLRQMMPVAVTAITPVLLKYGYQASQMGMMQLALAGSPYKEDEEINALSRQMREKMVPAEMLPVINAMMGVQMPHIQIQMPPMQMPFGLPVRSLWPCMRVRLQRWLRGSRGLCLRRVSPCRASRGSRSRRRRRRRMRQRRALTRLRHRERAHAPRCAVMRDKTAWKRSCPCHA